MAKEGFVSWFMLGYQKHPFVSYQCLELHRNFSKAHGELGRPPDEMSLAFSMGKLSAGRRLL